MELMVSINAIVWYVSLLFAGAAMVLTVVWGSVSKLSPPVRWAHVPGIVAWNLVNLGMFVEAMVPPKGDFVPFFNAGLSIFTVLFFVFTARYVAFLDGRPWALRTGRSSGILGWMLVGLTLGALVPGVTKEIQSFIDLLDFCFYLVFSGLIGCLSRFWKRGPADQWEINQMRRYFLDLFWPLLGIFALFLVHAFWPGQKATFNHTFPGAALFSMVLGGLYLRSFFRFVNHLAQSGQLDSPRAPDPTVPDAWGLSDREKELVRWVSSGLSNKEIAARLDLSPSTVRNYLHIVFKKAKVSSRFDLISRLK